MAQGLYRILKLAGFKDQRVVRRGGVRFNVDLREGIELSLFVFGGFQKHVGQGRFCQLSSDAVVFDVGANIGAICLPLAAHLPRSTVYAFEPTDYAFDRLRQNLALNPELQARVRPMHTFVSTRSSESSGLTAFSSWRVDGVRAESAHKVHGGAPKPATRKQISLDEFVAAEDIDRLDFIKIDTDGHELEVLLGAEQTLRRFRPIIVFELTNYLMEERGLNFEAYESALLPLGYRLMDSQKGHEVKSQTLDRIISRNGGIDVLALPPAVS
jgi:FkbM family methyltransferase